MKTITLAMRSDFWRAKQLNDDVLYRYSHQCPICYDTVADGDTCETCDEWKMD
jgi:hypothetical protein